MAWNYQAINRNKLLGRLIEKITNRWYSRIKKYAYGGKALHRHL